MNADTTVQQFLVDRLPGYRELRLDERDALNDFCLLWPVFEGAVLRPRHEVEDLLQIPRTLSERGVLSSDALAGEIAYLKERYFRDGAVTPEFHGLRLDRTSEANRAIIRKFLESGPEQSKVDALQGVLMILLRFRNNTFHGAKALDGYRGQFSNFRVACTVLMFILSNHPLRY